LIIEDQSSTMKPKTTFPGLSANKSKMNEKNEQLNAAAKEFKPRLARSPPLKSQFAPPLGSRSALRELEARRRAIIERRYFAEREYHARAMMHERLAVREGLKKPGAHASKAPPPLPPPRERRACYPSKWAGIYDRPSLYQRQRKEEGSFPPPYGSYSPPSAKNREKKPKANSQGRGFKTKQKKINVVYNNLVEKFGKTPYLKAEVDRSYETSRVHAKTWDGLNIIEEALEKVVSDETIEMKEIGFHKSMKNKYQQKGILVYIKVGTQKQVQRLFEIYNSYNGHLKDHAIAVSKEEREKMVSLQDDTEESEIETVLSKPANVDEKANIDEDQDSGDSNPQSA